MTNTRWTGVLIALLAAGSIFFFLPSDEKKIQKKLSELAEYCSSTEKEAPIEALKKSAAVAKLCRNPCWLTIASFNIDRQFSQKEISDHILLMKKRMPDTKLSFHDTVVEISGEGKAHVITTLKLDNKSMDDRFVDAYELDILLQKMSNDWFFSSFKVVEFMEK